MQVGSSQRLKLIFLLSYYHSSVETERKDHHGLSRITDHGHEQFISAKTVIKSVLKVERKKRGYDTKVRYHTTLAGSWEC
eukprot:scaffold772_cov199-Chaetoceros_neogracile.AAC.2